MLERAAMATLVAVRWRRTAQRRAAARATAAADRIRCVWLLHCWRRDNKHAAAATLVRVLREEVLCRRQLAQEIPSFPTEDMNGLVSGPAVRVSRRART